MSKHLKPKPQAKEGSQPAPLAPLQLVGVRELRNRLKEITTAGEPVLVGHAWRIRALFIPIEGDVVYTSEGRKSKAKRIRAACARAIAQVTR
jgi:hypothetical protein